MKLKIKFLKNITIFNLNSDFNLEEKINAQSADISNNEWILNDVVVHKIEDGVMSQRNSLKTIQLNQNIIMTKLLIYLKILILCPF